MFRNCLYPDSIYRKLQSTVHAPHGIMMQASGIQEISAESRLRKHKSYEATDFARINK